MTDRRHFTIEQEQWLIDNYHRAGSYAELTDSFNSTFGTTRKLSQVREKCTKRLDLHGMPNPTSYGNKRKEQLPVGTIRRSQTGTYIKVQMVEEPTVSTGYQEPWWLPIQKKVWQDHYGELPSGMMVAFLDGNRENLDIANLYPVTRQISAIMSKNQWWTSSAEHTLTAIKWCELWYAIKKEL